MLRIVMDADVDGLIDADPHERPGEGGTWRNGSRDRSLDTRLGRLVLNDPQAAHRRVLPGFLELGKTVGKLPVW